MKTIILSLHDCWWRKMVAKIKLLEIRKTKPAAAGPFRVLVYVTGGKGICGEFTCNHFYKIRTIPDVQTVLGTVNVTGDSCLTKEQLQEYAGKRSKALWGWAVSDVQEYEEPRPLKLYGLTRPPQSWCYLGE